MKKLTPIDLKRCQCLRANGTFMSFGPVKRWRCKNKAYWIATENKNPGMGHPRGRMTVCRHCGKKLIEQKGDFVTMTRIQ